MTYWFPRKCILLSCKITWDKEPVQFWKLVFSKLYEKWKWCWNFLNIYQVLKNSKLRHFLAFLFFESFIFFKCALRVYLHKNRLYESLDSFVGPLFIYFIFFSLGNTQFLPFLERKRFRNRNVSMVPWL